MEAEQITANAWYLLVHTAGMVERQADQVLQEQLGIGMSQFRILLVLGQTTDIPQRKLAEHLGQTEASISRQMKLLKTKGLLSVMMSPHSKREHVITLTAKGVHIMEAAQSVIGIYFTPMFAGLNEKERLQLQMHLKTLHDWVCQPGMPTACDQAYRS